MARDSNSTIELIGVTALAWLVGFLIFFPILWTFLTSFKTRARRVRDAAEIPVLPLDDWRTTSRSRRARTICLFAYEFDRAVGRRERRRAADRGAGRLVDGLRADQAHEGPAVVDAVDQDDAGRRRAGADLSACSAIFICSTRRLGIGFVLLMFNLPILVWMLYTYFKEIPVDILEAARMDGASLFNEIVYVLTPMAVPGIASTMLLAIILSWNEAFWTLNLTTSNAAPLTAFIASYSAPEGLFWAKLSAASTLAIAPILVLGWFSQKQLVRGLTFGAVK